jgi:predicted KAP-like P-loop ATPase
MPSEVDPAKQESAPSARTETVAGFSIRDAASAVDKLGFTPYVEAVAAFLTNEGTVPPLTMSVEGEWGSGKSSFMLMLEAAIEDHYKQFGRKAKIVRFSAWRYDKDEALWAAFALLLTNSLAKQLRFWKRMKAHCILQLQRFDWQKGWFCS